MGKTTLIELVADKDFNPRYDFLEKIPEKFTDFMDSLNGEINFITYKENFDNSLIKKEYISFINSKYSLENIDDSISETQENLKNFKWYNWHLPFMPRYWKNFKQDNEEIPFVIEKGLADLFFGLTTAGAISLAKAYPYLSPIGLGSIALAMKGLSEKWRRNVKQENEERLNYLLDCQDYKLDLEDTEINIIQNKEAQTFVNAYKDFELPPELKKIEGLSKEHVLPLDAINNHLIQIYSNTL